jgi:hypothetical protein
MKTNHILTAALLGLTLSLANAQGPGRGGRGPGGPGGEGGKRPDPAQMITHLSERYAALAGYDADKNGKLDATEQAAVAKAIEDGTLKFGPPGGRGGEGPGGEKPPVDKVAEGAAKMYEPIAAYDADKSGSLDETEQAAVKKAIEDGSLKLPRPGGRGPGGRGPGGPGGRPEGGAPPPPPGE